MINPEIVLLSNSIIVTNTSKSFTYTVASSVDSALPLAVMMTVGSSDLLMVSFSSEVGSLLLIMWTDAPLSTTTSRIFMFGIWPRCNNFLLSCLVGGSEEFVAHLVISAFHFFNVIVQIPGFLASTFHVRFNKLCTTSELFIRHSVRASIMFSSSSNNTQHAAFLLALLYKTLRDARQSKLFDSCLSNLLRGGFHRNC